MSLKIIGGRTLPSRKVSQYQVLSSPNFDRVFSSQISLNLIKLLVFEHFESLDWDLTNAIEADFDHLSELRCEIKTII